MTCSCVYVSLLCNQLSPFGTNKVNDRLLFKVLPETNTAREMEQEIFCCHWLRNYLHDVFQACLHGARSKSSMSAEREQQLQTSVSANNGSIQPQCGIHKLYIKALQPLYL